MRHLLSDEKDQSTTKKKERKEKKNKKTKNKKKKEKTIRFAINILMYHDKLTKVFDMLFNNNAVLLCTV